MKNTAMSRNALPKNQHYVPQFLLRGFKSRKKGQIHVLDKLSAKSFPSAIRNVAAETGFYNCELGDHPFSAEPLLESVEDDASRAVRKVRDTESLESLTPHDRAHLAIFIALQLIRVKRVRDFFRDANSYLREMIISSGGDPAAVRNFGDFDDEQMKAVSIHHLLTAQAYLPAIIDKVWFLMRAPKSHPLYISDNPVTLHKTIKTSGFQTLGLAVEGIELNVPLSKSLSLCLLCPKLATAILSGVRDPALMQWQTVDEAAFSYLRRLAAAIESGASLDLRPENIQHLNSLQVAHATRFVFSSEPDFSLARRMLESHPELRSRPAFHVGPPKFTE